jgi:uncharacterized protein YuzE
MKLSYDPRANVAYIRLREREGDVETIEVTSDFLVDIDTTGAVCGIELFNANVTAKVYGWRHHPQAQAPREAKGRPEGDAPVREGGHPAEGFHPCAEDG